jgi:hypothetical protein
VKAYSVFLVQVYRKQPASKSLEIWDKMRSQGIKPNLVSFDILIQRLTIDNNLEFSLVLLTDMEAHQISLSAESAERVISLAARLGHARLALDLATSYESEAVRPLPSQAWVNCLSSCAGCLYVWLAASFIGLSLIT